MKYIAFKGTYNEQIYNSESKTITFVNNNMIVNNITGVFGKIWKKIRK